MRASEDNIVRVLTIGNSFSNNATEFLPQLSSARGRSVVVGKTNVGGASLADHLRWHALAEAGQPEGRAYQEFADPPTAETRPATLREALESAVWDIVTIQQVSGLSHKRESFHPCLENLVEIVHRHAPSAEVVLHATWSYREDHPWFAPGENFSAEEMQSEICRTYKHLARVFEFRIIPVGEAFARARQTARWTYAPDTAYDFADSPLGHLPRQDRSLHSGWYWKLEQGTPPRLDLDAKHLNTAGKYLAACVWHQFLFAEDEAPTGFVPADLAVDAAADLRGHAAETIVSWRRTAASQIGHP